MQVLVLLTGVMTWTCEQRESRYGISDISGTIPSLITNFNVKNAWKGSGHRKGILPICSSHSRYWFFITHTFTNSLPPVYLLTNLSWMPACLGASCLISCLLSCLSQNSFPKTQGDFVTLTTFTKHVRIETSIKTTKQLSSILRFLEIFHFQNFYFHFILEMFLFCLPSFHCFLN